MLTREIVALEELTFVRAEGLALSPEQRRTSMAAAIASIEAPVARAA